MGNFNHKKAYEKDGAIGKILEELMKVAYEHDCPIAVITVQEETEEGMGIGVMTSNCKENRLPDNVCLGLDVIRVNEKAGKLIAGIMEMNSVAEANVEGILEKVIEGAAEAMQDADKKEKMEA